MNETKWLTVDEASLLCFELGLNRTKKTIRSWARNDHVQSRKQTTQHGEMWILERGELIAKINSEKEFAAQQEQTRTTPDPSEPVRAGTNRSEPVRTRSNPSEPVRNEPESEVEDGKTRDEIRSLKNRVQALTVDVRWRDQMLDRMTRENEKMFDNLQGQARYIGHLETDLMRLGGAPDAQFLAAPATGKNDGLEAGGTIQPPSEDRLHPDQ